LGNIFVSWKTLWSHICFGKVHSDKTFLESEEKELSHWISKYLSPDLVITRNTLMPIIYFNYLATTHLKIFGFQIVWHLAYLMKVIVKTRRAHYIWYLCFYFLNHGNNSFDMEQLDFKKSLKIPKGVIRIRISKKNRQHNGQKKKDKRTNINLQNIHIKLKIE
jgi:hypothetical protein